MSDYKDNVWITLGYKNNRRLKLLNPMYNKETGFLDRPELFEIKKQTQLENFNKFRESIREFAHDIDYIYAKENGSDQFIGVSNDFKFCYYRYYPSANGAQNFVFINGNKINLTDWLAKDMNQKAEMVNNM